MSPTSTSVGCSIAYLIARAVASGVIAISPVRLTMSPGHFVVAERPTVPTTGISTMGARDAAGVGDQGRGGDRQDFADGGT